MTSTGKRSASASAAAVLPLAVGPRRNSAFTDPHEEPIEVGQRKLHPGGAAVVAAARALGLLHPPQEGIHLGNREAAVGAHGGVTRDRGQELVAPLDQHAARAELVHLGEDRAQQRLRIEVGEQRGHRANHELARAGGADVETEARERRA
jgi:hypothetical protein